ncbi:MAG TPA: hypothetical protein VKH83_13220 [Methylomirabilota bacterium]|nr:hypothetical protein [Methylomirabilota bacterium]
MRARVLHLDAFAARAGLGNPAGVQGPEIGRDGRVHVWVDVCEVRVGGTACFVRELLIDLP